MSILLNGGEAVMELLFSFAASPITYSRGSTALATGVPAKLGRPTVKTEENAATNLQEQQADFIVRTKDFPEEFRPKVADVILWDGKKYQVCRPAKIPFSGMPANAPCWIWHSRQSHTQMRIHAKFVGDDE